MDRSEWLKEHRKKKQIARNGVVFNKYVVNTTNGEYEVVGNYRGASNKINIKHNICNHTYEVTPIRFKEGNRCPYCLGVHKRTRAEFIDLLKERTNGEYKLVGKYVNTDTPTKFKHRICGTEFISRPTSVVNLKSGCPTCNQSHGEKIINSILKTYKISFKSPMLFSDLKDINQLHYDFYIPKQHILIEYQGQQHYQAIQYFGGEEHFKHQVLHDELKRQYAKDNNYKLVEVPYTKRTIRQVQKFLEESGVQLLPKYKTADNIIFKQVDSKFLVDMMLHKHYLHRRVGAAFAYGLYKDNELHGMITYSRCRPSLIQSISNRATKDNTLELSRLYIDDSISQTTLNITSEFVGWSLRQLKQQGNWYIISFADSGMNHVGAIYQATNFLYCGMTNQDWDIWSGSNRYSEHWKKGNTYRYRVLKSKKYRYIKFIGSKTFKKHARKELKHSIYPYPKHDSVHYKVGETEKQIIKDMKTGVIYER